MVLQYLKCNRISAPTSTSRTLPLGLRCYTLITLELNDDFKYRTLILYPLSFLLLANPYNYRPDLPNR